MRVITTDDPLDIYYKYTELVAPTLTALRARYNAGNSTIGSIGAYLPVVLSLLGDDAHTKKVLDLGCGAVNTLDSEGGRDFEPWLCRALYELNIPCIGIDYSDTVTSELFEAYERNLIKPDSLDMLRAQSIDIAVAQLLFSSPQLERITRYKRVIQQLKDNLIPQLERVLKPDGVFLFIDYVSL